MKIASARPGNMMINIYYSLMMNDKLETTLIVTQVQFDNLKEGLD